MREALPVIAFVLVLSGLFAVAIAPEEVLVRAGLAEPRHWRAVQIEPGIYSVALCTDAGKCARSGGGTTGYRFTNAEDAKVTAARLDAIRGQGELNPALVP